MNIYIKEETPKDGVDEVEITRLKRAIVEGEFYSMWSKIPLLALCQAAY